MSNLIEHAKKEFAVLGWPGDCEMQTMVCDNVMALLKLFSSQEHSGSSAPYVLGVFKELAMFNPISPLTGDDSEWIEVGEGMYQNNRCSEVFKDSKDDQAYWMYGKIFRDADGHTYSNRDSRVSISFPWSRTEPEIVDDDPQSDGDSR